MICKRCNQEKLKRDYISQRDFKGVCRECTTNEELAQWIRPALSKAMDGLSPTEKQMLLERKFNEFRKKEYEERKAFERL